MTDNHFTALKEIDVKPYTEEKGRYSYLPWAKAVELLLERDPTATWRFEPDQWLPNKTVLVSCEVTAFGVTRPMHLPVWETVRLNNRSENKATENPDALDISNARMRCLVKAIALFGIGLNLYTKEETDLRPSSAPALKKAPLGEPPRDEVPSLGDKVPEDRAPKFVKTTSSKKEVPPTTPRGQKIMEKCDVVGVSRKEIEQALGSSVDKVDDSSMEHLKLFLLQANEAPARKSDLLKRLYDSIHDLA